MFVSKKSKFITNPVRKLDMLAEKLKEDGKKVIKLNTGDPARFFSPPKALKKGYIKAVKEEKFFYSSLIGVKELREEIAKRYKRDYGLDVDIERIVITQGISEAIFFLNASLINEKDTALFFKPFYPPYLPNLLFFGGRPIFCSYVEELGWKIDIDGLRRKLKREKRKPKYILLINPNNPTGSVLERKELEEIVEIAKDFDIFLVSDEIYDELVFDQKFTSICEVAKGIPYLIFNGASKSYIATGLRLGFAMFPEEDKKSTQLLKKFVDFASLRLCCNTPAQYAWAEALKRKKEHKVFLKNFVNEIKRRTKLATKLANETNFLNTVEPKAAFYIFPKIDFSRLKIKNDIEFTEKLLLSKYVQVVAGNGFGSPGHIRIVTLCDEEMLIESFHRIKDFLKKNSY
ncbi:MAG: aminotransferase class I/II-fold pyridoxal phosphate-dependent enzyme [Candidatus Micrarchaeales archaeon]